MYYVEIKWIEKEEKDAESLSIVINMIIKHGRHVFGEIHEMRKGLWAFLTAFRMLIGWAGKLRSRGHDLYKRQYLQQLHSLRNSGIGEVTCQMHLHYICLSVCLFVKRSIGLSRRMQKKGAGLRPFYSAPSCLKCMAIKCFKTTTTNEKSEHTSYVYYTKHCIAMSMSQLQLCDRHCDGQQCNILSVGQPASL